MVCAERRREQRQNKCWKTEGGTTALKKSEELERCRCLLSCPPAPSPPAPAGLCKVGRSRRKTPLKRLRAMKPLATLPPPDLRPPWTCPPCHLRAARARGRILLLPNQPRALPNLPPVPSPGCVMDEGKPTQPAPALQTPLDTS